MKVIIALSHPAHYFLFKYFALEFIKRGHKISFVVKEKDILENLLKSENVVYTKICPQLKRGSNSISILTKAIYEMFIEDFNLAKFVKWQKPDVLMGTDISISHIGSLFNIPSFVFNEDDYEINKLF